MGKRISNSNQIVFIATHQDRNYQNNIYWRAHSYATYRNGQWFNTVGQLTSYSPGELLFHQQAIKGKEIDYFQIRGIIPLATLFLPPEPLEINTPGMLNSKEHPDGSRDIVSIRATPPPYRRTNV